MSVAMRYFSYIFMEMGTRAILHTANIEVKSKDFFY